MNIYFLNFILVVLLTRTALFSHFYNLSVKQLKFNTKKNVYLLFILFEPRREVVQKEYVRNIPD